MPRVENALSQLVESFLPVSSDADGDEATVEQKHDQNLQLARSILKKYVNISTTVAQGYII